VANDLPNYFMFEKQAKAVDFDMMLVNKKKKKPTILNLIDANEDESISACSSSQVMLEEVEDS